MILIAAYMHKIGSRRSQNSPTWFKPGTQPLAEVQKEKLRVPLEHMTADGSNCGSPSMPQHKNLVFPFHNLQFSRV